MNIWQVLGIAPTADKAAIRHAYAQKTKACHPEEDPEGFNALHSAFEQAMRKARSGAQTPALQPGAPQAVQPQPGAPGSRQSCLQAEQRAYSEWLRQARRSAPPAAGGKGPGEQYDFTAAERGRL